MTKRRKISVALVMMVVFAATACITAFSNPAPTVSRASVGTIREVTEQYKSLAYDESNYNDNVKRLSDVAQKEDYITFIASFDMDTVLDAAGGDPVGDIVGTARYNDTTKKIRNKRNAYLRALKKAGVKYSVEAKYDTIVAGVAVKVATDDFARAEEITEDEGGSAIISETYDRPLAVSETGGNGVTVNDVNVYDTGIFDSSESKYKGDGVLVAVLDSGFDYTHSAYTTHIPETLAVTRDDVAARLGGTRAYELSGGLTAADVYVSDKIPFAYDYADRDPDVYPLESEHGTHVASIIAGQDDVVTGVAPGAQLALMKVFSDVDTGAKTSDILRAVEDCVVLGVDVMNMSLGSSCGFAREVDTRNTDVIYDRVEEAGISLIAAASNDYNATFGSEANGNLPRTSNPDSGTVGSPSTYSAALSVASISGVKTPYLDFNGQPIYYTEASNTAGEKYNFMDTMLKGNRRATFEYVRIAGIGDVGSYTGVDVKGKIALVRRGKNTFEEKVQAAYNAGAAGVIIYNNVSGDISMSVGNYLADWGIGAVSMSQDDGEKLAAYPSGTVTFSRDNLAGPFMSDFSSWGPTGSLGIKPEITAHGGDILAAVPGNGYDRLSGTSMASPNQAGVHALVRQYVQEKFPRTASEGVNEYRRRVASTVNQLLMSTADIAYNELGNPYAVRKQGAGLANLDKAVETRSYLYVKEGSRALSRTKLELGDDPEKTGEYTLAFTVKNISDTASSFDISAKVFTESVSKTLTDKDLTVTAQSAYMLGDTDVAVSGVGVAGKSVTVPAGEERDITVKLTLSAAAKSYIDKSFENGMYVEGFACLTSTDGGKDLNVPFLAFYGDWTQAPIFDLTFFETNPDELNDAIDDEDKTKPDAWATVPIAGMNKDYIAYMGAYYWRQNPSDVQIAAQEEHIALSNDENALNSIYAVWAGMLRNAKEMDISVTDTVTGRQIYKKTEYNNRKSYNIGGQIIYGNVEVKFSVPEHNLKNNTEYSVCLDARLDYDLDGARAGGANTNKKNKYEFTFTTDFEAPKITDVRYYTEYDEDTKETKLYADIDVYDNHYAQALRPVVWTGNRIEREYFIPVYGEKGSTSTVTIELTDYLACLNNGGSTNQFLLFAYDYAMNSVAYELTLPESVQAIAAEQNIVISENETKLLQPALYPSDTFASLLSYASSDESVAKAVNGTVLGVGRGTATITIANRNDSRVSQRITVTVLGEGDDGFVRYDRPTVNSFELLGYYTDFAYYGRYSDDRLIGDTSDYTLFGSNSSLTMFPGETVTLFYDLQAYFPSNTQVVFTTSDERLARIDGNGTLTALRKGDVVVTAAVRAFDSDTMYSASVYLTVQDPYVTNGPYLTAYKGIGENLDGKVDIPARLNLTTISQFAFSLSQTVDKDPSLITEDDPYYTTSGPVGEQRPVNRITEVYLPEGIEVIDQYAFAKMTALKTVVLPKSLRQINTGAFMGCTALTKVIGLENVEIISQNAFSGCTRLRRTNNIGTDDKFVLSDAIALGAGAFEGTAIAEIEIPNVQSVGANAFRNCENLSSVKFGAKAVKIDSGVFSGCRNLTEMTVNAPVVSQEAFADCVGLTKLTLGASVAEIGARAFANTGITEFAVAEGNNNFKVNPDNKAELLRADGKTLAAVAPGVPLTGGAYEVSDGIEVLGLGAFGSVKGLTTVSLPAGLSVGDSAFEGCDTLAIVTVRGSGKLGNIGARAFMGTALTALPEFAGNLGSYAFSETKLGSVTVPNGTDVGMEAFSYCADLTEVTVGSGVTLQIMAFTGCANLQSLTFTKTVENGAPATVDAMAFYGCEALTGVNGMQNIGALGGGAFLGTSLAGAIDLSGATYIGTYAFMNTGITAVTLKGTRPTSTVSPTIVDEAAFTGCKSLATVTDMSADGEKIAVGNSAFAGCTALASFPFANVTTIGPGAFANAGLAGEADLSNVNSVGSGAFMGATELTSAKLRVGTAVADSLFAGAEKLATVENLDKAVEIGAEAFMGTALTEADLLSAKKIGRLAFAESALGDVTLGSALAELGDNPFALTAVPRFAQVAVSDDALARPYISYDFTVSDTVRVIDGALYALTPNGGMELITYSTAADAVSFAVAEGTVRVSDYAAAGNRNLVSVALPYTLKAVGHAAFYGCASLQSVHFGSIEAPILEAEYDASHIEWNGEGDNREALNPQLMPSAPYAEMTFAGEANVLYYNNFVSYLDYVAYSQYPLTMSYPKNGTGYDTYVFNNYFSDKIVAAVVADELTRATVALINALPAISRITLADEAAVVAARQSYAGIGDPEQAALVTNLDTLVRAEARIRILKEEQPSPDDDPKPIEKEEKNGMSGGMITLIVFVVILAAGCVALGVLLLLPTIKKWLNGRNAKSAAADANETPVTDEADETPAATAQAEEDKTPDCDAAKEENAQAAETPAEEAAASENERAENADEEPAAPVKKQRARKNASEKK